MLEFVLKEPRPSTECINEYTLKNLNFSVLQILWLSWAVSSNHQNETKKTPVKHLKCFTLHLINLKYMSFTFWNNLQEKKELFHHILIFWDAPVCVKIIDFFHVKNH